MFRLKPKKNLNFSEFILWRNKAFKYSLFIVLISSLFCCSPASLPKQIYLDKNKRSQFNFVALNVSSTELSVSYSKESLNPAIMVAAFIPIVALYGLILESPIDNSMDKDRSERLSNLQNPFEKVLGKYFIEEVKNANGFSIEYNNEKIYKELIKKGYDATIELNVEKLDLRKQPYSNKLKLYVYVEGKMVDLLHEKVVWKKNESLQSDEEFTLSEIKEKLNIIARLIDEMLKEVAFRLANDIIYS